MFDKIKNAFSSLVGSKAAQDVPDIVEEAAAAPEAEVAAEVAADAPAEPVVEAPAVEAVAEAAPEAELSFQERARHVTYVDGKWAVKKPGVEEALELHEHKKEAVASATAMCKALKGELFVHRKDGKISSRNSYGKDDPKRPG